MKKNMKFEDAILALEDIVKKLEAGNFTLDESIGAFEEAVHLVKICNERLEAAEQKVRMLTEGEDGIITDVPFAKEDDET